MSRYHFLSFRPCFLTSREWRGTVMDQQIALALSAVVEGLSVLSTSTVRFFFHSIVFDFVLSLPLMSVHPSFFFFVFFKKKPWYVSAHVFQPLEDFMSVPHLQLARSPSKLGFAPFAHLVTSYEDWFCGRRKEDLGQDHVVRLEGYLLVFPSKDLCGKEHWIRV